MRNQPGLAAVLSLIAPGIGQIYNGEFLRGIFWLIITPGFWIGTGGLLGWVCHLVSAYTAFHRATLKLEREEFSARSEPHPGPPAELGR